MDIKLKWNKPISKILKEATGGDKTLKFAANEWHRLYFDFIPMAEGNLAENVDIFAEGNTGIIRHNVPYSHYQYTGTRFNFSKDPHPLSSAYWDKAAIVAGKGKQLAKILQRYIKRGG